VEGGPRPRVCTAVAGFRDPCRAVGGARAWAVPPSARCAPGSRITSAARRQRSGYHGHSHLENLREAHRQQRGGRPGSSAARWLPVRTAHARGGRQSPFSPSISLARGRCPPPLRRRVRPSVHMRVDLSACAVVAGGGSDGRVGQVRILILGLDNAGKTTILYRLHQVWARARTHTHLASSEMHSNKRARSCARAPPAQGEVVTTIPTIGFNVETVTYKNIRCVCVPSLLGCLPVVLSCCLLPPCAQQLACWEVGRQGGRRGGETGGVRGLGFTVKVEPVRGFGRVWG